MAPRTVLVDLGVVEPEGSLVYYVPALVPFAAWLSLVIVHNVFWDIGPASATSRQRARSGSRTASTRSGVSSPCAPTPPAPR